MLIVMTRTPQTSSVTHVQEKQKKNAKQDAQLPFSVMVDSLFNAMTAAKNSVTLVQERRKKTARKDAQLPFNV